MPYTTNSDAALMSAERTANPMSDRVIIEGPHTGMAEVCEPILRSLPDWFGIEDAIRDYAKAIDTLPTLVALTSDTVLGFLTIKLHFEHAAEIYVMAVDARSHRRGIGRSLVDGAERWLRERGIEYLQVKTIGPSRVNHAYACTRTFYTAVGFRPLEEFPNLWDARNPCLVMVKALQV